MFNPFRKIEVNHFTFRHPRVGEEAHGLKVAHITDIHHGRWVKSHHVEEVAQYINSHKPDLAVLTGDYVGYNKKDILPCAQAIRGLDAPTFVTLGNHDHWACTHTSLDAFESVGIPVLRNRSQVLETPRGHKLRLVGIDDAVTKNHDLESAFSSACQNLFHLVLCHVPELAPAAIGQGGHLVLSGHTHGLQFKIPGAEPLAAKLGMTYIDGAYMFDRGALYVSRGLGSASWPWRYKATPELTLFRLEHGDTPSLELEETQLISISHPRRWRRTRRN